jgi:hypothetical protein
METKLENPLSALRAPLSHKGRKGNLQQTKGFAPFSTCGAGLGMGVFNLHGYLFSLLCKIFEWQLNLFPR